MEIIIFVAIVFIGLVLRSNFQNIRWHSSEIDDLERRLQILEQKLEEKIATKSELHDLEQKLSQPIDSFNPDLDAP
jgi:predicted  nucleic acid-binding Zn-ribbon protein